MRQTWQMECPEQSLKQGSKIFQVAKASMESRGCKRKFVSVKEPLLPPNTPRGE